MSAYLYLRAGRAEPHFLVFCTLDRSHDEYLRSALGPIRRENYGAQFLAAAPIALPRSDCRLPKKTRKRDVIMNRVGVVSLCLLFAIGFVNAGCTGNVAATNNPPPVMPSITTQPVGQTVTAGQTASFMVVATGTAPLSYQWQKDGTAISGATSASYTTAATSSSDNGAKFQVVVSNSAGSVTSNAATLTVNAAAVAPSITTQPVNQTVTAGQTATFMVVAAGTAPLSYQWQKNGTAISGATAASYTTPATTSSDNGAQFVVGVSNVAGNVTSNAATLTVNAAGSGAIKTVFLILEENHNWSTFKGSTSAPYINNTLLPTSAHAEQYYNPPGIHPSEPNYLWLEAGTNFGILDDNDPSTNHQSTTSHLVTFLKNANISWKSYQEDISGTTCPLTSVNNYAPKHNPFVFFDDVTNTNDPASAYCIAHVRPFTELATDLTNNTVASYNFITPNVCNDGHDSCSPLNDPVAQTDTWLMQNLPAIMNSTAYKAGGVAIFIIWDEGEGGDGPIGMIVIFPNAKPGYSNAIHYDHSSTLRTMEEIFHVTPLLGGAASATDLSDLFVSFP